MTQAPSLFYSPAWQDRFAGDVIVCESRRNGGFSPPPYQSLNLGLYTQDDPIHVEKNRHHFCESLGISVEQLAGAHQVHGSECRRIHHPGQWQDTDAFITNKAGVFLTITVADCLPILFYDPVQKAVGAAHAGWRGTVARIAAKTFLSMRDAFGTHPENCWVYIGSGIGYGDFQVDADVADHFAPQHKRWNEVEGKFYVDLKTANCDQLLELGLPLEQIETSPYSTVSRLQDYFSHRAEGGTTGRMLGVIGRF